jgi:hypothetical protein
MTHSQAYGDSAPVAPVGQVMRRQGYPTATPMRRRGSAGARLRAANEDELVNAAGHQRRPGLRVPRHDLHQVGRRACRTRPCAAHKCRKTALRKALSARAFRRTQAY